MLAGDRRGLESGWIIRFWDHKPQLSGPGRWLRQEHVSPLKGGGHSLAPARPHHWYTRAPGFLTEKLEIHLSKRSGISFKNRRTQASRQTEATILVKTLSPVEAKWDPMWSGFGRTSTCR